MTSAADVPVCVDLEDGGGNAVTTYRNVAQAEAAGAAAIQIEDHVPGKSYGRGGGLHPVRVASQKIRAAVDARRDPRTVIIGRSEALLVGGSEQEALDRAGAYVEAGADMITVTFLPAGKVRGFKGSLGVPIANFVVGETVEDLQEAGVDVALYAGHSLVTPLRGHTVLAPAPPRRRDQLLPRRVPRPVTGDQPGRGWTFQHHTGRALWGDLTGFDAFVRRLSQSRSGTPQPGGRDTSRDRRAR